MIKRKIKLISIALRKMPNNILFFYFNNLKHKSKHNISRHAIIKVARQRIPLSQIDGFYIVSRKRNIKFDIYDSETFQRKKQNKDEPVITWLQVGLYPEESEILDFIQYIRSVWTKTRIVFLDWYAPSDLRFKRVFLECDYYVKKNLLKNYDAYARGFCDTNLVEYEAQWNKGFLTERHEGIEKQVVQSKILPGWSFASDYKLRSYMNRMVGKIKERDINIHCRMAAPEERSTWYSHMRGRCIDAIRSFPDNSVLSETKFLKWSQYMNELRNSKLCFSPFGFGEVCWRDFEAIACGAVIVKQDMSHLEVYPNIYIPNVTYIPVKWDLSDFNEQCLYYLQNENKRQEISHNAYKVWEKFIREGIYDLWDESVKKILSKRG